jgi:hypothetical protein
MGEASERGAGLLRISGFHPRRKSAAIFSSQPEVELPLPTTLKQVSARKMWQLSQQASRQASRWLARPKIHFTAPALHWLTNATAQ